MSNQLPLILKSFTVVALIIFNLLVLPMVLGPVLWGKEAFHTKDARGINVMDFVIFYEAGQIALSPDRFRAYEPAVQLEYGNKILAPLKLDRVFYIPYPPYFFVFMIPFGLMPLTVAYTVWVTICPLLSLTVLMLVLRTRPGWSLLDQVVFALAFIAAQPTMFCLRNGQTTWWILIAYGLFYLALVGDRARLGGLSVALASLKPQYALFLLAAAIGRRWRAALVIFACAMVVVLALGMGFLGWENTIFYPKLLVDAERSPLLAGISPAVMTNLRGLLGRILPVGVSLYAALACLAAALVYMSWTWWRARSKEALVWCMAVTASFANVVSPHGHMHDSMLMALVAALTLSGVGLSRNLRGARPTLAMFRFLLISYPLTTWLLFMSPLVLVGLPLLNIAVTILGVINLEAVLKETD